MGQAKANCEKATALMALCGDIQRVLEQALDKLDSASNWGMWDMLGGGLISTMIKHNRIDDAKAAVERARPMLTRLQGQLRDLEISADVVPGMGQFAVFADFFFDGLFADLFMQNKIQDFRYNVEHLIGEVGRAKAALHKLYEYEARMMDGQG